MTMDTTLSITLGGAAKGFALAGNFLPWFPWEQKEM
jgi:hypothetical protein